MNIYIYIKLKHCAVHLTLTRHCKSTILQLKKKKKKKRRKKNRRKSKKLVTQPSKNRFLF